MINTQHQLTGINRRLFTNIGLNFAAQIFLLLLTFAAAPYIVNHLGAEFFGVVALVQTVAGFAGLLNLGIGRALTKYISALYWKGEVERINEFFQTAWAVCILSGGAAVLLLISSEELIGEAFFRGGPEITGGLITFAIYVAAFGLFSSMLLEAVAAIPLAAQRFGVRNAIQVLTGAISSIGAVLLLAAGYSVRTVLLVNLLSNLIGVTAYLVASRSIVPGLKLRPRLDRTALRKLLSFSLPLIISTVSAMIVGRLDRFILAYYLPLASVAFYTLPYSLSEKLSMAVGNVTSVVLPYASELHAMSAHNEVHELYLRSTKILILMTLPMTMILIAVPGPILLFWLGPEYAAQGAMALPLLGLATFLNAITAVPTVTSLGIGRPWMPSFFAFATSVIDLVANILLIPRLGINGAALSLLLAQVLVFPFVYTVNRYLDLSTFRFLCQVLLRPLACAGVQFVFLLTSKVYISGMASLIVMSAISAVLFGVCALFGAITYDERRAMIAVGTPAVTFLRSYFQMSANKIKIN